MKRTITVFHHENGACEHWLLTYADGSLLYHVENSGHRFLDRGPEAIEERLTATEAIARWPWRASAITKALAEVKLAALVFSWCAPGATAMVSMPTPLTNRL